MDTEHSWRGGEAQVFSLCRGLAGKGYNQTVVCQPGSPLEKRLKDINVDIVPMNMKGEFDLPSAFRLARICSRRCIDLLHAHDAHAHALAWFSQMVPPKRPVVVTRRVDFPVGRNPFSRLKYTASYVHFIAISRGVREVLLKGGVSEKHLHLVHSGIDPRRFEDKCDPQAFLKRFSLGGHEIIIGNIGALTDHKGQTYLIDAAPQILEKMPQARIFIIGEGELRSSLEAQIRRLNLEGKVILTGYQEQIGDALSAMDVFVLSSHLEGLCTSLLDAMLMGVPVVATNTGGVPDAIIHGETGILIEPRNPGALAWAVIEMLEDRERSRRFIEAARKRALDSFTVGRMVDGTSDVYRTVLEPKPDWTKGDVAYGKGKGTR